MWEKPINPLVFIIWGREEREVKIPDSQSALCIQAELGYVLSERAVVVLREENDWLLLPHNETPTASEAQDRPEKLCSLLSRMVLSRQLQATARF